MIGFKQMAFVVAAGLVSGTAAAVDAGWYGSLSAGYNSRADSDNSGAFSAPFTTGAGTTIPSGTVIAAGTSLGWDTEFDGGYGVAGALGYAFGNGFRAEFEIPVLANDIDSHQGVAVGGGVIDSEDAGVLITGSPNLGVTVGEVVADGRGEGETIAYMVNAYYDFDLGGPITPYVGAGVGFANSEIEFEPSGIPVADDDDSGFAWQLKAGVAYSWSAVLHVFGEYRYFTQEDAAVDLSLLPAGLDVENEFHVFSAGLRYHF